MLKKWIFNEADSSVVDSIIKQTGLSRPIAKVLAIRDVVDPKDLELFLYSDYTRLADPYTLPDMSKAVERIWEIINSKESIVVFGDYDLI